MTGFYKRRESQAALWCLRIAVIAIPFLLLSVLLHRNGTIATEQLFWLLAFAIAMLITSLVLGLKAAVDLWELGNKGGTATVYGVVLSILMLIPFGLQFLNAIEHPKLNDVATDVITAPAFLASSDREGSGIYAYDPYFARVIVGNYPELVGRRYEATPERVARSIDAVLKRWGWPIIAERNFSNLLQAEDKGKKRTEDAESETEAGEDTLETGELAGDENELTASPRREGNAEPGEDMAIEIAATSFLLKLKSRIVIRLQEEGETTLVDMRSKSEWGPHDFGSNADNITDFLTALDTELAGLAGE